MHRRVKSMGAAVLMVVATGCASGGDPRVKDALFDGSSSRSSGKSSMSAPRIPVVRIGQQYRDADPPANPDVEDYAFKVTVTKVRQAAELPLSKDEREYSRPTKSKQGKFVIVYMRVTNDGKDRQYWTGVDTAVLEDAHGRKFDILNSLIASDFGNLSSHVDYQNPLETRKGFLPFDVAKSVVPKYLVINQEDENHPSPTPTEYRVLLS